MMGTHRHEPWPTLPPETASMLRHAELRGAWIVSHILSGEIPVAAVRYMAVHKRFLKESVLEGELRIPFPGNRKVVILILKDAPWVQEFFSLGSQVLASGPGSNLYVGTWKHVVLPLELPEDIAQWIIYAVFRDFGAAEAFQFSLLITHNVQPGNVQPGKEV